MFKKKQKEENSTIEFYQKLGYGLLISAILYLFWLIIKIEILNKYIFLFEIYLVAIVTLIGLILGGFIDKAIKHYIKKQFDEYGITKKIQGLVKEELSDVNNKFSDIKSEIVDVHTLAENAQNNVDGDCHNIDNGILDKSHNTLTETKNTVIVNVKNAIGEVKKNLTYICPSRYSFKDGLEYIAFYKDKRILGYGKLENFDNYNDAIGETKEFKIGKFEDVNIRHEKKGALIQNKMYCNFEKLKNANTTEDITN